MDANQLLIIDIQGSAGIVLEDGSIKALSLGDTITVGDIVITAANSSLLIDVKGVSLAIPANQRVQITPDLVAETARDSSETTIFDDSIDDAIASLNQPSQTSTPETSPLNDDVSDFLEALEGDGDLLDNLEATAAGGNAAAGSGGGTSFVELARIAEGVDPSSLAFDDSFEANNDGIFAVRDTTDGVIPEVALIGDIALNDIGLINNPQPVISGTSTNLAGQSVVITITDALGNVQTIAVIVQPDGTFTSPAIDPLPDGPIVVDVTVIGPDGEPISDTITADIDTTAPILTIDTLTDSASPVVTITGSVAGLDAGADITLTVTDSAGQVQTFVTQLDQQGNWSITTAALAEGPYNVQASAVDDAGNEGNAQATAIIDLTAPVITIDAIADTNDVTPTLTGTVNGVTTGTLVSITVVASNGATQTLTAIVTADGSWSAEVVDTLVEGEFTVTATVADSAGNTASDSEVGVVDSTAPTITINTLGESNDTTPTISGTALGVNAGTTVTLVITDSNGVQQTITAVTDATGNWQVDPGLALAEGDYTVTASVSDEAGNTSSATATGIIDLTAPLINIEAFADSNDTTPVITGTVSGVDIGSTVTVTVVDSNGDQQILTAVVNADNTWQVDVSSALAEGAFNITATVVDNAGNQASDTSVGLIDVTAPLISLDTLANSADDTPTISGQVQGVVTGTLVSIVVVDANGVQQTITTQTLVDGSFAIDVPSSLAQGQYSVVATVVDTAGNQASDSTTGLIDLSLLSISINIIGETNDTTPALTGSTLNAAAGDQVQVVVTDINGQSETLLTTVDANGNWAVTPSQDLAEGEFSVTAVITDSFGNTANTAITGIVDITAPTILIDTVGDINDSTPVISGTTEGVLSGSIVSVVVTDSQNNSQSYSATTDANGNWSIAVTTAVASGEFTILASVTDAAGNTGTDTETGEFNNTSPLLTLDFDQLTSDNTPLISGTSNTNVGSVVTVLVTDSSGNTQTLLAVVGADGSWSISPDNALSDGDFSVTASVEDTFGNQSTVSDSGIIDATAPTLTIDNLGTVNDTTPTISGQTNEPAGSVVNLVVNDGVNSQNLTAIVNGDGSWSVEVPTALQNGTIDVVASITDAAGNQATANSSFILNDNAPSISINAIADTNDITPIISGASDAPDGAIITVVITDSNNNSQTLTTTVSAGVWSVDALNAVAEGQFSVTASVTVDGLTSDAQAIGVIDTQAPTFDIDPLSETNDITPTITGSSDEIGGLVSITVTDANSAVQTLTATVLADGTWSVDVATPLAEGAFQVDGSVTDAAGNTASDTENGGVIDTQAPSFDIDPLSDTNDTTPIITGSSDEIGGIVSVIVTDVTGAVQTLTATVLADGTWSVDVVTPLAEGAFQVDGSVTDAAGNTASDTENGGVIDTQAPSFDIDPLSDTNDTTPTITGSSDEIGGIVSVIVTDATGAVQTLTTTVLADGTWSVDVPTPLAEGAFQVEGSVTDAAGNTASDTENGGVIDTQAPSFDIDTLAATNDSTPTITGSSDEIGGIVSVIVTDATGAVQTLTTTVLADGTWSVDVATPLAEGAFQVEGSVTDAAGNTASDTENGGVIDTQAPSFDIDTLAATNDSTPTITGSSDEIGGIVSVIVTDATGAVQTLTATVLADGTWSVDVPTPLGEGAFQVEGSVTDAAGNTASDTENGGVIDTQAPIFDIDTLAATNDSTPTITGSSDEIGGIVSVIVTDATGAVQTLTATVLADGTWSVDVVTPLAEGEFQVDASVTDAAGNTASDTENGGVIDTQAPTFDIDPLSDTNDTTPTITGSSDEIGGIVSVIVTDATGAVQTLTTTVLADGSWSVDVVTPLAEGAFQVDASVTDAAGNTASDTENGGVIDTQAPTFDIDPLSDTNDTTPTITGSSDEIGGLVSIAVTDANGAVQTLTATVLADGSWSVDVPTPLAEGVFVVDASVTDVAGNTASDTENGGVVDTQAPSVTIDAPALTNDNTPVVTGTSDLANSEIAITFTDANGSHTVTVQTNASGNWSAEATQPLIDGAYTVTASLTDDAGNTGNASDNGVVDTIPPELAFVPTFLLGQLVTLSGTSDLPAGSTVTVTQNLLGGGVINYTATTDAAGNWSLVGLSIPLLTLSSITASASDEAGNVRTINSTNFDGTPPTLTASVDTLSNDNTPEITGTTDAGQGATVTVVVTDKDGNSETLTATVDANGDWAISPTTPLPDGAFSVDVSVRDGVGNETTESISGVIDTIAPTLTIQGVGDGSDVTPVLSGTSNEIGGTVTIVVTDANGVEQTLSATVQSNGQWSVEVPNGLSEGDYSVETTILDAAGNSTQVNLTGNIDTSAPVVMVNDNGLGNDATPTITGTSTEPAGTVVSISIVDINGDSYGLSATVLADGSWQVTAPSLPDGAYTVMASITDAAGNTGSDTGSGSVDTLDPLISINSLGAINDDTPTLSGTSSEPQGTVITLTVTDSGGTVTTLSATVDSNGDWAVTAPVLADDDYTVVASVSDAAGNSNSATDTFTLNTLAPSITINAIGETNDTTPTINGTSDAADGSVVTVVINDGINPAETIQTTVLGNSWSVTASSDLAEGDFSVTATVEDAVGNQGTATITGVIDTTMPDITINPPADTNDTTPTISGTASAPQGSIVTLVFNDAAGNTHTVTTQMTPAGTWSVPALEALAEGTYTVTASVSDQAGNPASASVTGLIDLTAPTISVDPLADSSDVTPMISGQSSGVPAGTQVNIEIIGANGAVQSATATTDAAGNWSVEASNAIVEGEYTVNVSVTDSAGNTGTDSETGVIDTIAPSVTIDAPALTNDNTPVVTGTSDLANSDIIITFSDANGSHTVTVQTNASGNWSAEATQPLIDGAYTVTASLTDDAGNTGNASDNGVVDTIPPALAFVPTFLLGQLVTLSGTSDLPAGSTVTVTQNLLGGGVINYTATTDAAGNWSLVGLSIPLLTLSSITASASDEAGNVRTINSTNFDGTPPTLTASVDTLSNDNTPEITGTTDAGQGATVTVVVTDKDGNSETLTATVDANGDWAISPTTPLPDGAFSVDVSVRDGVGNETTESISGVIDTIAPTLTIQGVGDGSDVTPVLSGTSNEIGGTVTIVVTDANGVEQTLSATVQSNGQWSVEVPNGLSEGDYSVETTILDAAGNSTQVNLTGNIDTSAPVVMVNDNGLGNDATPTITGTSTEPAGTVVSISIVDINGDSYGLSATVLADGSWQVTAPSLPDGAYTVMASITDAAGNSGSDTGSGSVDTLDPLISINSLGAINDDTPTLSGTSSEPQGTVITLTVTDSGGTVTTLSATVDSNGDWVVTAPVLADDDYTVVASVTDAAGNSNSATDTFTLNTLAPSITINAIGETNDTTPTINGTSSAADGSVVTVVINDGINPAETIQTTVLGNSWSVTASSDLAEGDFSVTATVEDAVGNQGTATITGVIDTTMPDITINPPADTNDTTPTISGTASAPQGSIVTLVFNDAAGNTHTVTTQMTPAGTWSVPALEALAEGTYTVTASVSDQAGNPASASVTGLIDLTAPTISVDPLADSSDVTPMISGQSSGVSVGTQVNIEIIGANGAVQSATATTDAAGNWSVEASNAIVEGEYTVNVSVTDSAGNTGTDSETGVIDTIAPSVTIDAPALTNDNTPVVTGTSDLANSDIIITFSDANGSHTVTVQTNASGNWSAEATQPLIDGAYTVTASLIDDAGNTGNASDNGVVDTVAPELRIIPSFLLGNLVSLSGDSDLPAGSTITITENLVGGLIGATYTATTDENGNWQLLNLTVPLLNLAYVTASATDEAGNTSTVSTLDFDNIAPDLSVSVDALSNDTTPVISGDTDMGQGTVINLTVVDSDNVSQTFTAVVQADQTWSVSVPQVLAEGTYTVTASVRDGVGNLTTEQTTGLVDSVAPSLAIDNLSPTADATPTITGSSNEIGGQVLVVVDGQTLQATVASNGTWQVTIPTALNDGDYPVEVSISDDAGNQQTASTTLSIDTITPVLTLADPGITNDPRPTISGTSTEPQGTEVVIVLVDANGDSQQFTTQVQADGSYSASPTADIADGAYTVTATITDAANNIGTAQGTGTVDTLDPTLTLDGLGTFNDSTPVISGSSDEIGATVTVNVSDDSNTYQLSAVVQANGTWSVQVSDALNDGIITITANVSDAAGNQASASGNATLDTNAPTISITSLQPTLDTTPTISGTTDARDGTDVTIEIIAAGIVVQTLTTQALAGQWTIDVSDALVEGSYTVNAVVSEDGLTGSSSTSLAIDLTAPTLAVNTPSITNDTTPLISGTSDAAQGTIVTLLVTDSAGTEQSAQATVKANGTWSVALATELAEGNYSVAATIADIAGNSNSAQTTGVIDLTPPTVLVDPISITADKTPVVSGAALDAVAGNTVAVTFTDAQGASHTVNTTLAADLTWQVEASQTLAEGAYTVTAVVTDTAGNAGQQIANAVIDSINPEITIDQSSLVLTQDTTPLITGTSDEANATVEVTFTDANGIEQIVSVTTDAQGDWQAAANTALAEGVYSVKATITDMAGNQGEDSKTGGEVDITPPELDIVPSFLLGSLVSLSGTSDLPEGSVVTITNHLVGGAVGLPYTATVDANGDWSVLNLSVSLLTLAYVEASATDAAGNTTTISTLDFDNTAPELTLSAPALTMDSTPTISGTTDLGEGTQVTLVVTGQGVATQTFSATVQANGSWSVNVPQGLGDGQYTVKASVRDGVGNLTEQTASGVIDTTAPSLVLNTTAITSDDTPLISGTSNLTGGEVTVTIDGQTLTATVAQNGLWQVSAGALSDGTYTVTATVADQAGNSTTRTGNISVDTVAPNITVASQGLANDATPIISGTSDEAQGSTVSVVIVDGNGDTHNLTAVVDSNGDWQVEADALPEGEFDVTASITDAAGLTSSATTAGEIDTVAPVVTVDAVGTINLATPTITGSSDEPAGTVISVDVTDSTQTYSYTTQVQADGSWSIDVPDNLEDGSISVVASVTDLAGNTSTSDGVTGVLNTSAPSIGISPLAATNDTTPEISGTSDAPDASIINLVISNASGDVQSFTANLNAGVWSVDVPLALLEGSYTVTASVTEAGLTSSSSASLAIDLTAPTLEITSAQSSADSTPLISGTSLDAPLGSIVEVTILDSSGATQVVSTQVLANGSWSVAATTALAEGDAQVTAVITDTAGNSSNDTITLNMDYTGPVVSVTAPAITNDWTPLITGTVSDAPAGTLLTILITDSAGSKQTITTNSNADGSWSVEAIQTLSDGQYTVQVSAADELGNTTTSSTTGLIDTLAPVIAITSGLVLTADTTPLISGTSNEPGGIVTVNFNNGLTQVEVTTTADASGNWSVSANANLLDANYTVTAEVTDAAGNTGSTSALGLEVDTTPVGFEVTNYYWGLLGIGLTAEGTVEEGSSVYIVGSNLLGLGLLDIDVLESGFEVQPNIFGEWSALLSVLDLGSWLDYRFVTVDEAGNYLVKDILNNIIDQGNEPSLATTSADTGGAIFGTELLAEQQSEPEASPASLATEPESTVESIDLSMILASEVATSNTIEPLDLTINDVLSDAEQPDLLALDAVSEESSIAFNGTTSTTAEPALDVQNQSEEMIKKLIESGNNQIDS